MTFAWPRTYAKIFSHIAYRLLCTLPSMGPRALRTALMLRSGPGCSSIGSGFMAELGPFYPTRGGRGLQRNRFAWNRVANVLFVDSPAFAGFSYSNDTADLDVGE